MQRYRREVRYYARCEQCGFSASGETRNLSRATAIEEARHRRQSPHCKEKLKRGYALLLIEPGDSRKEER